MLKRADKFAKLFLMRSQKDLWLRIFLFTAFLLLAVWLVTKNFAQKNKEMEKNYLRTPKIIGLTVKRAENLLSRKSLKLKIKAQKKSSIWEKGLIISQLPLPGEEIARNETVFVVVSLGQPTPTLTSQLPTIPAARTGSTPDQNFFTSTPEQRRSFSGYCVCIDPGHQAKANLEPEPIGPGSTRTKPKVAGGGTGVNSKTPESQIVLKIALKLRSMLEAKEIKVVMTRTKEDVNISNKERALIANKSGADLFVRIHLDSSSNPNLKGITTLYPAKNQWTRSFYQQSKRAAQIIHPYLIKETGAIDRGLKERGDMTGFNWSKVPVILVEAGFLSNPLEDQKLNTEGYQNKIATGLTKGILAYLKK